MSDLFLCCCYFSLVNDGVLLRERGDQGHGHGFLLHGRWVDLCLLLGLLVHFVRNLSLHGVLLMRVAVLADGFRPILKGDFPC